MAPREPRGVSSPSKPKEPSEGGLDALKESKGHPNVVCLLLLNHHVPMAKDAMANTDSNGSTGPPCLASSLSESGNDPRGRGAGGPGAGHTTA